MDTVARRLSTSGRPTPCADVPTEGLLSTATVSPPIPWHLRLEARVIAGISVLVALSLGAVLLVTTRPGATRSFERTSTDLDAARSAFYQLADDRAEFAAARAALVTALPVFRA